MVGGYAGFITTNRYLQAQGIVRPQVVSSAIVLFLHPVVNWIFIYRVGRWRSRQNDANGSNKSLVD